MVAIMTALRRVLTAVSDAAATAAAAAVPQSTTIGAAGLLAVEEAVIATRASSNAFASFCRHAAVRVAIIAGAIFGVVDPRRRRRRLLLLLLLALSDRQTDRQTTE